MRNGDQGWIHRGASKAFGFWLLAFGQRSLERPIANSQEPKAHRGFTLIELLLYVTLSSAILFVVIAFLSQLLQSRIKNQVMAEVDQQGVQVMQLMTQTIRNAQSITAPTPGISAASLTIATSVTSTTPTVFDLSASAIRITEGASSSIPLTNGRIAATGLTFQNLSRLGTPGVVRIQFTLVYLNPANKVEYQYQQTFIDTAALK